MRSVEVASIILLLAFAMPADLQAAEPQASEMQHLPAPIVDFAANQPNAHPQPVAYPLDELQREQLRQQLLDLEPDRRNRQLIEQVREVEEIQRGVDVTDQPWVEVDGESLTWGGRIQGDWINWANDRELGGQSNYFEFRRIRLFAAGEGYGIFDYMLELEFANDSLVDASRFDDRFDLGSGGVELKDAYINATDVPLLGNVRLGHFITPIGLERLTSSKHTTFLERALPNRFLPGRELGLAAFRQSVDQNSTLAAGMFFHDLSDAAYAVEDDSLGYRLIGRMTHTPIYDELSDGRYLLHTGLGYSYTQPRRRSDPLQPAVPYYPVEFDARAEIHRGDRLIETGELNTQHFHVLDAETALVWGPFSLQGEAAWTHVREYELGTIDLFGAYVYASYFLTGENRNYDRREAAFDGVTPYENFWLVDTAGGPRGGRGAWEVAARWSYLDFSDIARQQLNDLTVGCNWYWNPNTRLMFNWIHPFANNSPQGIMPNSEADILAMRLEVHF
jgi:phosphate-selective porin OprO/OprP